MNTLERRKLVRAHVIDASIARTSINKSRRQRADTAKTLRKAIAANQFARSIKSETISYPRHG